MRILSSVDEKETTASFFIKEKNVKVCPRTCKILHVRGIRQSEGLQTLPSADVKTGHSQTADVKTESSAPSNSQNRGLQRLTPGDNRRLNSDDPFEGTKKNDLYSSPRVAVVPHNPIGLH